MGRGTPLGQYGSAGGVLQPGGGPVPPQQGSSPNSLSIARNPVPYNQQGPGLGMGLSQFFGQQMLPPQQQQMGGATQGLMGLLRGQSPTQQPMVSNGPAPTPGMQSAYQAATNQMAGRADNAPPAPAPAPRPDAEFNINTAMNTFGRSLNDRVQSGQMSVADAQKAQAEMRALQLNPAMANRAAATEIAQRHLQVGPYSPNNVAQRQLTPAATPEQMRISGGPVTNQPPAAAGMPQNWNVSQAYRDFGGQLSNLIKAGKLTPQQANAIKDPAFAATKLGNTQEAYTAMQKALSGLTGYADGGYVTQAFPEDPRMQAMRAIQRIGK